MKACLMICLFVSLQILGQNQSLKFKHLSLENGLSQSSINCIVKDSKGFMWFGTEDGLNKYDGTNFTIYRHVPNDDNSLSDSYINAIVELEDGFLWIGTNNGLNYYNPNTEQFTRYLHDPANPKSLGNNHINTLQISREKLLIIGTSDGLFVLDPKVGFSEYTSAGKSTPFSVSALAQDKEGYLWILSSEMLERVKLEHATFAKAQFSSSLDKSIKHTMLLDPLNLWIGTDKGLLKFNLENQITNTLKFYGTDGLLDERNSILSITNRKNKLWIGTMGGGLIDFDKDTGAFQTILHDPNDNFSPNSSSIKSIFQDEKGILWLGTYGGGINKHDPNQFKFEHYRHSKGDKNSLSENTIRSVVLDKDGELWVGTHDGLNRLNRKDGEINVYRYDQNNTSSISSNVIWALQEDPQGRIWAGTWLNGLNCFDKKSGRFKRYISLPGSSDSIGQVRALEVDDKGNIWLGGHGLWKFNPMTLRHENYPFFPKNAFNVPPKAINSLYFAKTNLLWIGSQNGLISLDTAANSLKEYLHDPKDTLSISHNYITSIVEDKNGSIWVGTYGGGINKLNVSKGVFRRYNTSNGLLNDVIYGILIDEQGFIWFTSNAGLGRFDPYEGEFKYYGVDHGIQSEEFNAGVYFKSKDGEFFFGGINGLNSFYPNTINDEKETSRIVFTDFRLMHDKKIPAKTVLDKHISQSEQIRLEHNQNTFTLEFAELNYSENVDNRYEYQLVGLKKNWNDLGKKHSITLGNLSPGDYTLNVRVHNDLTKTSSIGISISPPLWQTNWAYAGYALLAIALTTLLYRNMERTKRIRKQFELKLRHWENDNAAKLQNSKIIDGILSHNQVELASRNQKFLERVIGIVEDHMDDADFDVEKFAIEMFMSRSQLYRKLKAATGYSTTEFIRLIRLKKAAQLLKANSGTVTEIAYKVGFENIGYFSKCFKEVYGKPPSQYNDSK